MPQRHHFLSQIRSRTTPDAPFGVLPAQIVLGLGTLFIGTGEFASMGLLPDFARSVHVGIPTAGHLVSAYALGVVIGSPLVVLASARMERRRLLVLLALTVLVGNMATALAPSFGTLLAARFLSALPHGAYFGVASVVAASMVPHDRRASAVARVMVGLAIANVIGVPVTTFLGQTFGWRSAFAAIGVGGALLAILIPFVVPQVEVEPGETPAREVAGFRSLSVWLTLATPAIGFAGMFAVYSYLAPTLTDVTGEDAASIPLFLALFGGGMVAGNLIGGWLTDRAQTATIMGVQIWNAAFFLLFVAAAGSSIGIATVLFLIGMGFAALPAIQARLMDEVPKALSLAAAMTNSAFNVANALGAWTGGAVIAAGWGYASTGYVAAASSLLGLVVFSIAIAVRRRAGSPIEGVGEAPAAIRQTSM